MKTDIKHKFSVPNLGDFEEHLKKELLHYYSGSSIESELRIKLKNKELGKVFLEEAYDSLKRESLIYFKYNGLKKLMHIEKKYAYTAITSILWVGDLDNDDIPDYMIGFDDFLHGYIGLFLSSEATGRLSHKLVSIMRDGDNT